MTVYNFEVEDNQNYYVGLDHVLVHNTCVAYVNLLKAIQPPVGMVTGGYKFKPGHSARELTECKKQEEKSEYKEYDLVPYDNYKYKTPGLEKHHGIMNEWDEHNIPGYTKKNAPTILLTPEKHQATKNVYNEWLKENYGKPVGVSPDWDNMSKDTAMKLANEMFDAAEVPQSVRDEYFEMFDIFITGG